jgi:spore germination protein PB
MNLTVNQSIVIHHFRVGSVTNSSILQIGSAGIIKPLSQLFNTGGFTAPAPEFVKAPPRPGEAEIPILVPLPPVTGPPTPPR